MAVHEHCQHASNRLLTNDFSHYPALMFDLTLIDWIGVLGSFVIAGAYLAVSRSWVDAERPTFQLLNLAGASMILASLYFRPNAGAILIEVLWVIIAITSLFRWWRSKL